MQLLSNELSAPTLSQPSLITLEKKFNCNLKVAPLRTRDGKQLLSDADKADAPNVYFSSVFIPVVYSSLGNDVPVCDAPVSDTVDFSVPSFLKALLNAKHTLSSGSDSIPSVFWHKLANVLAFPVSVFFSSSYLSSQLPCDWKHAVVIPVYIKGDSGLVQNYRPISLTCTLCKIMESLIKDNMLLHLLNNNLLDVMWASNS